MKKMLLIGVVAFAAGVFINPLTDALVLPAYAASQATVIKVDSKEDMQLITDRCDFSKSIVALKPFILCVTK